jgi:hypothetical protein
VLRLPDGSAGAEPGSAVGGFSLRLRGGSGVRTGTHAEASSTLSAPGTRLLEPSPRGRQGLYGP